MTPTNASLHIKHLKADIDQYQKSSIDTTQKSKTTTQKTLTATPRAILDYLKDHSKATRQEVAEALGNITEDSLKYLFLMIAWVLIKATNRDERLNICMVFI